MFTECIVKASAIGMLLCVLAVRSDAQGNREATVATLSSNDDLQVSDRGGGPGAQAGGREPRRRSAASADLFMRCTHVR